MPGVSDWAVCRRSQALPFRLASCPSPFHCAVGSLLQTAIMAAADLYLSFGDALLPLTDVGGLAKPMTSMLAQVRRTTVCAPACSETAMVC